MTELFINRVQVDPDGLDFEGLRKEGIRLTQAFSGDIWSDYNLHDPGVTILESLCYALTDLIYRLGFDTVDYLVDGQGKIKYRAQPQPGKQESGSDTSLYRPDAVFPCAPLTITDYRKLILDELVGADNVWIKKNTSVRKKDSGQKSMFQRETEAGMEVAGLYSIFVKLNREAVASPAEVEKSVQQIYAANRNLCEDLDEVVIVSNVNYSLCGEIEISGSREAAEILAEIFFTCAQYFCPGIPFRAYAEMYRNGTALEDLFDGVLTGRGYILDEDLHDWRGHFSVIELIGKVAKLKGVKDLQNMCFKLDGKAEAQERITLYKSVDQQQPSYWPAACLRFPESDEELRQQIQLKKSGKLVPVTLADIEIEYKKCEYRFKAQRNLQHNFDWLDTVLPQGTVRELGAYISIQNNFPNIYGINAFGVPASEPPQRKAQAAQLKAYLLLFEQLMANFLGNTQNIRRLFSLDATLKQSYFPQFLGNESVPDAENVYVYEADGRAGAETRLAELVAGFDNFGERRNRVLDYLLALYGEKLSANSLRHFFPAAVEADELRAINKLAFLNDIVDVNQHRAAAPGYRLEESANRCGMEKKLRILLGLNLGRDMEAPAGSTPIKVPEMHIMEHILLRPDGASSHAGHRLAHDFFSFRMSVVFSQEEGKFGEEGYRKLAQETVAMNCPAHVYPEIFWLDAGQLGRFSELRSNWLKQKYSDRYSAANTNQAASELLMFLHGLREVEHA